MSMPSRSSPLSDAPLPASSRSGVSRGAFPPRPKSVRIWVVSDMPETSQGFSAAQSAEANARPMRGWRLSWRVLAVLIAVSVAVAIALLAREYLGR